MLKPTEPTQSINLITGLISYLVEIMQTLQVQVCLRRLACVRVVDVPTRVCPASSQFPPVVCVAFVSLYIAGLLSQWVQHTLAKAVQMLLTVWSAAS